MKSSLLLLICCCGIFSSTYAQGPQGYWRSDNNKGFFDGLESVEMRVDRSGNTLSGNVYYIWEHGIYFQNVSLGGNTLVGDSVELKELLLVSNRNGNFAGDCRGVFYLRYSRDKDMEYLKGVWKKPPGSAQHCPETEVTFYRAIHPDAPKPALVAGPARGSGVLATAAVAPPPPDPDSLRLVLHKSRKDSLELVVPHHADTARLEFYDNGIVDHDRISLFLGDSLVLKNYELLAEPRIMHITLDKNKLENILSLYAENEGDIPPNTALMLIYVDDGQRFEVRLSSDMKTNAKVVFKQLP